MKIIEQGKKIETKVSEKTFKCTYCNCKWLAESDEYVMIGTPGKLYVYCRCPNCGNQTWERED